MKQSEEQQGVLTMLLRFVLGAREISCSEKWEESIDRACFSEDLWNKKKSQKPKSFSMQEACEDS